MKFRSGSLAERYVASCLAISPERIQDFVTDDQYGSTVCPECGADEAFGSLWLLDAADMTIGVTDVACSAAECSYYLVEVVLSGP